MTRNIKTTTYAVLMASLAVALAAPTGVAEDDGEAFGNPLFTAQTAPAGVCQPSSAQMSADGTQVCTGIQPIIFENQVYYLGSACNSHGDCYDALVESSVDPCPTDGANNVAIEFPEDLRYDVPWIAASETCWNKIYDQILNHEYTCKDTDGCDTSDVAHEAYYWVFS